MSDESWQPNASFATLRRRMRVLTQVRQYFAQTGTLEVETPILSRGATTDPNIDSLYTSILPYTENFYLQTSPEFAMKRLLAAGSGDIYQVCKVFRQGEKGRFHHPEFTLLEWYRLGFDHHNLICEVESLLSQISTDLFAAYPAVKMSYRQAFQTYAGFDPFTVNCTELEAVAKKNGIAFPVTMTTVDEWLDLLMGELVTPHFKTDRLTFISDFPVSQASLAKVKQGDYPYAERFEAYYGELELANGFHELSDADEQERRFKTDQKIRQEKNSIEVPYDKHLINALNAGLPNCAGVALGIDRLLMLLFGSESIEEVISFSVETA